MGFPELLALALGLGVAVALQGRSEWIFVLGLAATATGLWAWRGRRRRGELARDLHDGLGAQLAALVLMADGQGTSRFELREGAEDALAELRRVLASLHGRLDLEAAVRTESHRVARRSGWRLVCEVELKGLAPSERVRLDLLRSLQELLCNVARHAQASWVRVRLRRSGPWLELSVEDDGRGWGTEPDGGLGGERLHWGLRHLEVRARDHGGGLVRGVSEAGGARVSLRFSLGSFGPLFGHTLEVDRPDLCPRRSSHNGAGSDKGLLHAGKGHRTRTQPREGVGGPPHARNGRADSCEP